MTNKAVGDLSDIWKYTAEKWSENQADTYYRMLINAFNEIAEKPEIGRRYTEVKENLLGFRAEKHIVFYRIIENGDILIIRILHERMDLKRRLPKK